jgi:hypothetical protein
LLGSSVGLLGLGRARQVAAGTCKIDCAECQFSYTDPETGNCQCISCEGSTGSIVCCGGSCEFAEFCACPGGCPGFEACCDGTCAFLFDDPANCGACGNACAPTQICVSRNCVCPEDTTACAEACVDLRTDPAHCGACDTACASGQSCVSGACQGGPLGPATPIAVPTSPPATGPVSLPGTGAGAHGRPSGRSNVPLVGVAVTAAASLAAWLRHRPGANATTDHD